MEIIGSGLGLAFRGGFTRNFSLRFSLRCEPPHGDRVPLVLLYVWDLGLRSRRGGLEDPGFFARPARALDPVTADRSEDPAPVGILRHLGTCAASRPWSADASS